MPEIKLCEIEGCNEPRYNQAHPRCIYCLGHANQRPNVYRNNWLNKKPADYQAKRAKQFREDYKKKHGISYWKRNGYK